MRTIERTAAVLLAAALGAGPAACAPGPGEQGAGEAAIDTAAILESVDSLRLAYQRAVAEADWPALGRMVTEDAMVVQPGPAAWDSAAAASEAPFPEGSTLEITPRETRVLSRDWVYQLGSGALTWTPEGADGPRTLRDTYLVLLHRTDGGWKVHREVASSRPLPEGGE